MKKIYFLLFLQVLIFNLPSFGQSGTWTWIGGTDSANAAGVFGQQGVPSVNNHPPGMYEPCEWKDRQGNFWIFGGVHDLSGTSNYNDLWRYSPLTNEWTWMNGSGLPDQPAFYGTKGVGSLANSPGQRQYAAATWVDTSGTFWLFGGTGTTQNPRNDLWKYSITSNEWTWVTGDSVINSLGVHGIQGIPDTGNTPGARDETCSAWTDSLNNLWLFGGVGYDDYGNNDYLNDVCMYNISTNEWTWMKGSAFVNASPSYGTLGVADTSNDPGARRSYTKWKDLQNNFWILGGMNQNDNCFNDMWKYDLRVNEWTWMSGPGVANDMGTYQTNCGFDSTNNPYSRYEDRSSVTDNCGRFWLFGGVNLSVINYFGFNDLWVFDPQQMKWNWVNGTNVPNQSGSYGSLGVADPSNIPPSRRGASAWWGNDNKFYMFGGLEEFGAQLPVSDVWVYNPDTNCVPVCALAIPPIASFYTSDTIICADACINFTDLSDNATSWHWKFPGATDTTSTSQNPQSVCYINSGIYNVTLIVTNTAGRDSVTFSNYISVKPVPPTPVITQHHDSLYCSTDTSYRSYQWYQDSTIINGATDTLLIVSQNGNYNLRVTNSSGCNISVGIAVIIGIQNYTNDNIIFFFPNPATDQLLVSGNWKEGMGMKLTIFNILGEVIYTDEVNRKQETVNCKPFSSGIYFIEVASENARWIGRFVKE